MIWSSIYSTVRNAMVAATVVACICIVAFADDSPQQVRREAHDLSQQVQRAAYLAKVKDLSDREMLAVISHKLDLLLAIEHQRGVEVK